MASASNLKGKAPITPGQRLAAKEFRGMECYICKQVGNVYCVHMISEEPRVAPCFNCGQLGYFALECTDPAAPYDPQLLCLKCKMDHNKKYCPKAEAVVKDGAETEADQMLKKLYNMSFRRNENKESRMSNNIDDPYGGAKRMPVSPYHTRPGMNIWDPPPKRLLPHATPNGLPAQLLNSFDQLFYPQWTPWNGPQILENLHHTINNNTPTQTESSAPQNPLPDFMSTTSDGSDRSCARR